MNKLLDNIEISANRMVARWSSATKEYNSEEIIAAVKQEGIKGIINYAQISNNISNRNLSSTIIAEGSATLRAKCSQISYIETLKDWEALYPAFKKAGELISALKKSTYSSEIHYPTTFVYSGDVFLKIITADKAEDLYGNKSNPEELRPIRFNPSCINQKTTEKELHYIAQKTGYIVHRNGVISIESPLFKLDNYELNYAFYPVLENRQTIYNDYIFSIKKHKNKYPLSPVIMPDLEDEKQLKNFGNVIIKSISKGNRPQPGRDAQIDFLFQENKPENYENLKDFKHYIAVKEGQVLAVKSLMKEGVEGCDIYGNIHNVKNGKDLKLQVNKLIGKEVLNDKINYFAISEGILKKTETSLHLSEALVIPGNVDYSTGNIQHSKNILVYKDVKPYFKVESDSNVIIKGSIEEGAEIKVKGDLIVEGGIIGKKTKVFAGGDITVNFIQDSDVYTNGSLLVLKSIIGSSIYATKKIRVSKINNSNRTQVFGCQLYSFSKMELPSVGSPYKLTNLCCGYNPKIKGVMEVSEETIKSIELQISRLVNSIGFSINSPAIRRIIQKLTVAKKLELKKTLTEMKDLTIKLNNLKKKKEQLKTKLYSVKPEELEIKISEKIIPETNITIMKKTLIIKNEQSKCNFFLDTEDANKIIID